MEQIVFLMLISPDRNGIPQSRAIKLLA